MCHCISFVTKVSKQMENTGDSSIESAMSAIMSSIRKKKKMNN